MMNNLRARRNLITLDGLDGAGKSSGLYVIREYLEKEFPTSKINFAEGYTFNEFGKDLKALMMKHRPTLSHDVLYNLFRAIWVDAWEKHGEKVSSGEEFLLTDRWLLTTGVYQDENQKRVSNLIQSTNALPGLTFLLTVSKDVAIKRITQSRELDNFELEFFKDHETLQRRFIERSETYCHRVIIIDTDNYSQEQVADQIRHGLDLYFGKKK